MLRFRSASRLALVADGRGCRRAPDDLGAGEVGKLDRDAPRSRSRLVRTSVAARTCCSSCRLRFLLGNLLRRQLARDQDAHASLRSQAISAVCVLSLLSKLLSSSRCGALCQSSSTSLPLRLSDRRRLVDAARPSHLVRSLCVARLRSRSTSSLPSAASALRRQRQARAGERDVEHLHAEEFAVAASCRRSRSRASIGFGVLQRLLQQLAALAQIGGAFRLLLFSPPCADKRGNRPMPKDSMNSVRAPGAATRADVERDGVCPMSQVSTSSCGVPAMPSERATLLAVPSGRIATGTLRLREPGDDLARSCRRRRPRRPDRRRLVERLVRYRPFSSRRRRPRCRRASAPRECPPCS